MVSDIAFDAGAALDLRHMRIVLVDTAHPVENPAVAPRGATTRSPATAMRAVVAWLSDLYLGEGSDVNLADRSRLFLDHLHRSQRSTLLLVGLEARSGRI